MHKNVKSLTKDINENDKLDFSISNFCLVVYEKCGENKQKRELLYVKKR